ncbi:MAG: hypothetical protein U0325_31210 [Polyangiales bacterium]
MVPLWFEAWIDEASVEYFLILRANRDGTFAIVDPREKDKVVETFVEEREARVWLNQEGFARIESRYEPILKR